MNRIRCRWPAIPVMLPPGSAANLSASPVHRIGPGADLSCAPPAQWHRT
ncbi:hypothetical protein EV684_11420 [Rubrivivax gelatinosus]|uniref:Uncharacterized protein n=1 Tax=Rubrivivax gelatinosus TaxID=28068 RepID=A0A4R2M6E3_RUBGE|nr:hypothetical protein EV684_11420 [Rubrivivax gelatinosus]